MDLVVGATGAVGSRVCELLRKDGRTVRALVRPQSEAARVAKLREMGVELVEGDLKEPGSLDRACNGVETVISTASSMPVPKDGDSIQEVDREGQKALVSAAAREGVRHFVFISFMHRDGIQFPLAEAKEDVEAALEGSGMDFTILHASFFCETWLTPMVGFDHAAGSVRIYGDGLNPISFVSNLDVAACAVASLGNELVRNRTIEIGGPESISPIDVVRIFEEASGRSIAVDKVPEPALRAQLAEASNPVEASFAGLMTLYATGDGIDTTEQARVFPGVPRTSVREYARRVVS